MNAFVCAHMLFCVCVRVFVPNCQCRQGIFKVRKRLHADGKPRGKKVAPTLILTQGNFIVVVH